MNHNNQDNQDYLTLKNLFLNSLNNQQILVTSIMYNNLLLGKN
jgi:hypothetical protein